MDSLGFLEEREGLEGLEALQEGVGRRAEGRHLGLEDHLDSEEDHRRDFSHRQGFSHLLVDVGSHHLGFLADSMDGLC